MIAVTGGTGTVGRHTVRAVAHAVRHHVAVSIVGIERVPYSHYEAKVAQERVVREGGVPAVLLGRAAVRPQRALVLPLAAAWALFSVLHLTFHSGHLGGLGTDDAIVQTVGLAAVLAPSGLVAVMSRRLPP